MSRKNDELVEKMQLHFNNKQATVKKKVEENVWQKFIRKFNMRLVKFSKKSS